MPHAPALNELSATPTPVTLVPFLWPLLARIACQSKVCSPRSAASSTNALETFPCTPSSSGRPSLACPAGALIRISSSGSMSSCLAAFCISGENIDTACRPPGARCGERGGVFVKTDRPRKRWLSGWYISDAWSGQTT